MKIKSSFTLIEILVVIGIMLVFLGMTLAQFNGYNETLKLKSEARKLVDTIELARKKSLASDLYDNTCANFNGYQLSLATNQYVLSFCCNNVCTTNLKTYNFGSETVNKNISIFAPASGTIIFTPLMTGFQNSVPTIEVKNTLVNKCVVISISPIGIVNLDETLINC